MAYMAVYVVLVTPPLLRLVAWGLWVVVALMVLLMLREAAAGARAGAQHSTLEAADVTGTGKGSADCHQCWG
jgi:hypothetical protein